MRCICLASRSAGQNSEMVLWSQCLAMLRDFEGKCARLGQAIKQETDQVTGKRDLARLSHWFEAFGQQTGWCILCVHSKQCKTHVTPHILYPLSDRTHAVFHVLMFVSSQDVSPAVVRRMTVHTPKRRIEHRKTNASQSRGCNEHRKTNASNSRGCNEHRKTSAQHPRGYNQQKKG